jgi:hypothetical protein
VSGRIYEPEFSHCTPNFPHKIFAYTDKALLCCPISKKETVGKIFNVTTGSGTVTWRLKNGYTINPRVSCTANFAENGDLVFFESGFYIVVYSRKHNYKIKRRIKVEWPEGKHRFVLSFYNLYKLMVLMFIPSDQCMGYMFICNPKHGFVQGQGHLEKIKVIFNYKTTAKEIYIQYDGLILEVIKGPGKSPAYKESLKHVNVFVSSRGLIPKATY